MDPKKNIIPRVLKHQQLVLTKQSDLLIFQSLPVSPLNPILKQSPSVGTKVNFNFEIKIFKWKKLTLKKIEFISFSHLKFWLRSFLIRNFDFKIILEMNFCFIRPKYHSIIANRYVWSFIGWTHTHTHTKVMDLFLGKIKLGEYNRCVCVCVFVHIYTNRFCTSEKTKNAWRINGFGN